MALAPIDSRAEAQFGAARVQRDDVPHALQPAGPADDVVEIGVVVTEQQLVQLFQLAALGVEKAVHLEEGSGLSRGNKFTARGLAKLLHEFAPHAELMRRTKAGSRYKTGSLSGVRTLAGFAQTQKHGMVRFVISIRGNAGRLRFSILRAIERGL